MTYKQFLDALNHVIILAENETYQNKLSKEEIEKNENNINLVKEFKNKLEELFGGELNG